MSTCQHGTPTSEDCPKCRELLNRHGLMARYVDQKTTIEALQAEVARLQNIISGCPVCSELERNIKTESAP